MPSMDTIEKLFERELKDVYDAEKRLTKALPKMAKAADSPELKSAFEEHLGVTKKQVERIEQIFETLGKKASAKPCAGMKGLLEEGEEAMTTPASEQIRDLALIGAARRVEHYEMAAYLSLRDLAQQMDANGVLELLEESLREEEEADEALSEVGLELAGAGGEMEDEDEDSEDDDEMEEESDAAEMPVRKSSARK